MIIKGFPSYIIVFLLLALISSCGSSLDPRGYDDLLWGASIDAVKSKYPKTRLFGSDTLIDESNDGAVASRKFQFYKDKLIKVEVTITGVEPKIIYQKLKEKYKNHHKNDSFGGAEIFVWKFDTTIINTVRVLPYSRTTVYYQSTNLTKQRIADSIKARTIELDRQNKEMSAAKL